MRAVGALRPSPYSSLTQSLTRRLPLLEDLATDRNPEIAKWAVQACEKFNELMPGAIIGVESTDTVNFRRFDGFGVPPPKQGDYAYLLHIIKSLKPTGKAACILPHGVLFRGNAEAEIRTNLIKRGYIRAIIGLPPNLFYGTSIPACIVFIDKENAAARKGVFLMDASAGYIKDGPKNRLREMDLHRIVDVFHKGADVPKLARMVSNDVIAKNDFNLNLPRYIDSHPPEDRQDIVTLPAKIAAALSVWRPVARDRYEVLEKGVPFLKALAKVHGLA
jgi:N-6 DNA Methylase